MSRLLLIDLGNSRLKWALVEDGKFIPAAARTHRGHLLDDILEMDWLQLAAPDRVMISCVATTALRDKLSAWITQQWQIVPQFLLSQAQDAGLINGYDDPKSLGSDRWAGMIAAYHACHTAVCVINCGTAVTVDIVSAEGRHQGGLILPGLYSMSTSLSANTALPTVQPGTFEAPPLLGKSTSQCIASGIHHALGALLTRVLVHMQDRLQQQPIIYITGGDAQTVLPLLPLPAKHEPHLVLQGLARLIR